MKFDVIIGCEVHIQLSTKSKAFCTCRNEFGGLPNSRVCPVCLGLPGSLPVSNTEHILSAVKAGLSLGCKIAPLTKFDRKNYMYPDLPKAYQISQYDMPICTQGKLLVKTEESEREIRITRIHMEEDTGKNIHSPEGRTGSFVDYNRSGTPLLEIVSEPDMRTPAEAEAFVRQLHEIMRYLEISDCNMEEGSLRCDANINLWVYEGNSKFATPIAEIKNMNSFKAIRAAMEYEVERQKEEWQTSRKTREEAGKATRGWNEARGVTILQRVKEEEADYRYFPEPDLKPISVSPEYVKAVMESMPELPDAKRRRYEKELGLSATDSSAMTAEKDFAVYFEKTCEGYTDPKKVANWMQSEVKKYLNAENISMTSLNVAPDQLRGLLFLVDTGTISGKIAKDVFVTMAKTGRGAKEIVDTDGLSQISDSSAILKIIDTVIANNPGPAQEFRDGKEKALGFLMGQVMKVSQGKVNPAAAGKLLAEKLKK